MKTQFSIACSVLLFFTNAQANIIDFDDLAYLPNYGDIPNDYKSHSGDTPDIAVSYSIISASGAVLYDHLDFWDTGYGDLENVGYPVNEGTYARITFTPDSVTVPIELVSMQLAGYSANQTDERLRILDGSGNTILDYSPQTFPGTGHITYNVNVISTGPLTIEFGPSWNSGIDNIVFNQLSPTQTVPDSTSSALALGLGVVCLAIFGCRSFTAR